MNALYNLGIHTYVAGIKIAAAFGHRKAKLMIDGRRGWQKLLEDKIKPSDRYVWFHAASLGEFEQGRPLMEQLRELYPQYKIIVSFFSPSGYEVRKNYKGADIVCYLPFDTAGNMSDFVASIHPEKVFFVKYEFWGNCIEELYRRNIPVYLISGIFRPTQIFFKSYGGMMRKILRMFEHLFVQDQQSFDLLTGLGLNNVTICGDTRFDRVLSICHQSKILPWAETFVKDASHVMVAGSSWPKDEDILLEHFNNHPEMKLIIAPHEIHEEHIAGIISKLNRPYMRYSQLDDTKLQDVDCLIIDAIGFLSSIYRYGQIAYIGGGFGVGIHNTLEAAVYGIPVIFGPNHQAFREALGLLEAEGAYTISNAASYNQVMDTLLNNANALKTAGENARAYVQKNAGASATIFNAVFTK